MCIRDRFRNQITDQPTCVAQGKIALGKPITATGGGFHPVRCKERVSLLGAHSGVPKRACKDVVALSEAFKSLSDLNTSGGICVALGEVV